MIDVNANILMPDGTERQAKRLRGGQLIGDIDGNTQMLKIFRTSREKEYTYLKFENGKEFFCLPYLSILTWEGQEDAQYLEPGEKVLARIDGKLSEVAVKDNFSVNLVTRKRHSGLPRSVRMFYLETYEDKPIVVNDIVIGFRWQLEERAEKRSFRQFMSDF